MAVKHVLRVRSRELGEDLPQYAGVLRTRVFTNPVTTANLGGSYFRGFEWTQDATHPTFLYLQRAKFNLALIYQNSFVRYFLDTGGSFISRKFRFDGAPGRKLSLTAVTGFTRFWYDGMISPIQPEIPQIAPNPTSDSKLSDLGAKQILYNLPLQPLVGISQTLAELKREGLPRVRSLASFRNYTPRKAGEDYLTWQFGFRPVIQDIYALADSLDSADKRWRNLVNGAGKLQRRRFDFPVETSSKTEAVVNGGTIYPLIQFPLASGESSTLYRDRKTVTKRTFTAAYVYHLPAGSTSTIAAVRKVQQLRTQYGLNVDPQLLWELTPWSWLIDWLVPIGDFIQSVSSLFLGNTALAWAYISEHTVITDVYSRPGAILADGRGAGTAKVVTDYKRRIPASPFGFGLNWLDLSPKQLSILAAIGITR